MELTAERKRSIRRRLEPLLAELDPELKFIQVILDSSRENLGVVVQKDDQPAMLRLDFIHYISMPDGELRDTIARQLRAKKILPADTTS
ncbi:MAG TPA: hypothetical protein VJ085_00890 [Candidatus Acidoferrales bacterium]|nr:hypothetical protein [Candidatus Acidoferrales bacterium]